MWKRSVRSIKCASGFRERGRAASSATCCACRWEPRTGRRRSDGDWRLWERVVIEGQCQADALPLPGGEHRSALPRMAPSPIVPASCQPSYAAGVRRRAVWRSSAISTSTAATVPWAGPCPADRPGPLQAKRRRSGDRHVRRGAGAPLRNRGGPAVMRRAHRATMQQKVGFQ